MNCASARCSRAIWPLSTVKRAPAIATPVSKSRPSASPMSAWSARLEVEHARVRPSCGPRRCRPRPRPRERRRGQVGQPRENVVERRAALAFLVLERRQVRLDRSHFGLQRLGCVGIAAAHRGADRLGRLVPPREQVLALWWPPRAGARRAQALRSMTRRNRGAQGRRRRLRGRRGSGGCHAWARAMPDAPEARNAGTRRGARGSLAR